MANSHLPALSSSPEDFCGNAYDYLIIGGGTAGLVVAARLTEDATVTVGVLEAGKNQLGSPLVDTPAAFLGMMMDKEYDWAFFTEPQVGCVYDKIESCIWTDVERNRKAMLISSITTPAGKCLVEAQVCPCFRVLVHLC